VLQQPGTGDTNANSYRNVDSDCDSYPHGNSDSDGDANRSGPKHFHAPKSSDR
jgi:hypothetical protein